MFDQQNRGKGSGYPHGALPDPLSCPECVDTNPRHHHHEVMHTHDYVSLDHSHEWLSDAEEDDDE